ncbi:DNA polymerase IV [Fusibacter bizertensis]|jgi:Nucleotidyltransferase/DNA polymerase involved in DNA repair|uniref:DNA polymerase IV n=1 Tax=Fusibacter bizertensis TaxID=1488331 RepID=A0ABT6N7Z4_9FIRM|nr:DNA polymerase IV [Fusibacter bizertensis]MDH8676535.1 DNA polymerase IV [Fusibacter bizertensis]
MSKVIFHIDVNSAYLSWEAVHRLQHGDPLDLRTVPSAVGGDPIKRHGIILAKSIPAKPFKIQTGESLMAAFQKCPTLKVVPPRYDLYLRSSNAMIELISEYSSQIQRYSIDECFVDFTDMIKLFGDPIEVAYLIKERIKKELGFTVSIGVSSNKLLAKVASDLKKPDAVTTLFPEEISQKMWPLPVGELFMVGRATVKKLNFLGIETIGDLANYDVDILKGSLKSQGILVWNYANGIENSPVKKSNHLAIKSIGNSSTIPFDIDNQKEAHLMLLSLSEMVAMRLRDSQYLARLVSITYKTNNFNSLGHQKKFEIPTDHTTEIYHYARTLFDELWDGTPLRHLGVRVSELCENDFVQLHLFDAYARRKNGKLDQVIDELRGRFEPKSIMRGCFVGSGIKPLTGGVGEDDFPLMSSIL